jgi:hypothetical protein
MSETLEIDEHGRDPSGRFASHPNNTGRSAGTPNRSTTDARIVRDQILQAFNKCDGKAILQRLAMTKPVEFMKIVVSVLPKEDILSMDVTHRRLSVVLSKEPNAREVLSLVNECLALANGAELSEEHVHRALENQRKQRERARAAENVIEADKPQPCLPLEPHPPEIIEQTPEPVAAVPTKPPGRGRRWTNGLLY